MSGKYGFGFASNSASGGGRTTDDVVSMFDVGSIEAGDTIPSGSSLQDIVNQIFIDTFYPTFVLPSAVLSHDQSSYVEIGTITDVVLTLSLNRGRINGDLVGGVWNPSALQDYRSGVATNYVIEGNDLDLVNTYTVSGYEVLSGSNSFSGTVDYGEGPQPVDSDGVDYNSRLAAGSLTDGVSFVGSYPVFATTVAIDIMTKSSLGATNGVRTFIMVAEDGVDKQKFDIPDSWNAISLIEQYNTLSGAWDTISTSSFTESVVTQTIQGNEVNYKRYTHNGSTVGARTIRVTF